MYLGGGGASYDIHHDLDIKDNISFLKVLHKNVLATIDFSMEKFSPQKNPVTMSVRKNFVGNMNLGQKSCLNLDKFGIDNDIPE